MEYKMKNVILALTITLISTTMNVFADSLVTESAPDAAVYFIQPANGATVEQTFKVVFGLSKMGVAPAGTTKENTGHHHILIDTDTLPDLTQALPATDKIKHFGGGQTETQLTLPPGKHTLQLVLGNFAHIPHSKPVVSDKITITVK
ncbi:MAG: hypothetical protein ACI9T9_003065 [Oleiphilaceae bacterium]|jgi:hypothetical protein